MEEIKKKKKLNKKPLLICLAIALVFAVIGFIDIKSNATESLYTARLYCEVSQTFQGTTTVSNHIDQTVTSNSPIYAYVHNYTEPITGEFLYIAHVISKSPISGAPNANLTFTDSDGVTWYYSRGYDSGGSTIATINYATWYAEGVESFCIINGSLLTPQEFMIAFKNGTLDYTQDIDYDSFEIDNDMPIVENILRNDVVNKKHDSTLEIVVPDTYRYDYITWKNTSDLELQFEVCPVLQYYKGPFEKDYVKEYQGNWLKSDILTSNTNSFLWLTRITSVEENYPEFTEWFYSVRDTYYPDWNEILNFTYGYRVRYVDKENSKVGPWVYVVPDKKYDTFKTYVKYADDTLGNSTSADGSREVYDDLENIEDALVDVDKENQFKEEYKVYDGNIDVEQATGWLNTVVGFIKGTPQVVGSVLGFLPQPILYGMYVCIFLGIIASGIAIVKALL